MSWKFTKQIDEWDFTLVSVVCGALNSFFNIENKGHFIQQKQAHVCNERPSNKDVCDYL